MIVNSQSPEFGYELISTIPYAYYLHEKGWLTETISSIGSSPFYFFSPKHTENNKKRSWYNVEKMNTPNKDIHKPALDLDQFKVPPYRDHYKNDLFKFKKPTLIIYNRYNNEWPGNPELNKPINFFSIKFLRELFDKFQDKYQIVYFNIDKSDELQDNAPSINLGDWELLSDYPKILNIYELMSIYELDYNTCQLMIMANCELFVTMNGGGSILASYFGGKNIIYTNKKNIGDRIYPRENQTGDFGYYHLFGGSEIVNVHTYENVLKEIKL